MKLEFMEKHWSNLKMSMMETNLVDNGSELTDYSIDNSSIVVLCKGSWESQGSSLSESDIDIKEETILNASTDALH